MARYDWSASTPPPIGEHSVAKHEVYREYLRAYLRELTKRVGFDGYRINVVDGFSGGGLYTRGATGTPYHGSPLILLSVLQEMQVELQARQEKPFLLDYHLHLVDEDRHAIEALQGLLRAEGHSALIGERVFLHCRTFQDALPAMLGGLKRGGTTILVLDQFGWSDVPFGLLRTIFAELRKPEVILTFDYARIENFLTEYDVLRATLASLQAADLRREEFEEALKARGGRPRLIQQLLHRAFLDIANYFTPFFVTSRESNLAYWLVHLSTHPRARDVMVGLHWTLHNHFSHFGGAGYDMLGFDPAQAEQGPYLFDDGARTRTRWALRSDLPRLVAARRDGILFSDLVAAHSNGWPADSTILRGVVSDLHEDGELRVLTARGNEKRRPAAISAGDRIILPRQPTLFLPPTREVPFFARRREPKAD